MSKNGQSFKAALITKGRKTGKEHSVWLKAVIYNEKMYFSRHEPNSDWFLNSIQNPAVEVEFDSKRYSGIAKLVNDEILSRKISELKYPGEDRAQEKRVVIEVTIKNN